MIRCYRIVLALLAGMAVGPVALGQPPAKSERPRIVVTGLATVYAKPDAARLTFTVGTQGPTNTNVRIENDKQVARTKKALAELAFPNVEVQILPAAISTIETHEGRIRIGVNAPPQPPMQTKSLQTFFVVMVRTPDLDKLRERVAKLADAATEHGAIGESEDRRLLYSSIRANGTSETLPGPRIEWLADNSSAAYEEAIKRAVKNAWTIARAAVNDPNGKLQVVETKVETRENQELPRIALATTPRDKSGIAITASVQITFTH